MPRARTLVLTVSLAAALAAGAVLRSPDGSPVSAFPSASAQAQPVDLGAEWQKQEDRALADAVKEYEKLYEWCVKKQIESSGNLLRRKSLRYQPDHPEIREFFGYERKSPDAPWMLSDVRKEKLREVVDIEDPKATDLGKRVATLEKKLIGFFKALANKAKMNAADKAEAANGAAWKERETRAWERVLQIDSTNEEAHRALGHPKLENRYVSPFALPFMKARQERKKAGLAVAQSKVATKPATPDGIFAAAGLAGGAATSDHFVVNTTHGPQVAVRLAEFAERAAADFVAMYGVDAALVERIGIKRFDMVKDKDEHEKLLRKANWDEPRIKKFLERFAGVDAEPGELSAHNEGGANADDMVMHFVGHGLAEVLRGTAVAQLGSPSKGVERYLMESIAYDVTRRLTGTTYTTCGAFAKYGGNIEAKPNQDLWIELAKMQVETDDDVPLTRIWRLTLEENQITGPVTVKGYAFLQYLFEADTETARKFVRIALAQGTPTAALAIEPAENADKALDALDAKYREWILKSW